MYNETLAYNFTEFLKRELGETLFNEVIARNEVEPHPDVCHSHDFCDANMVMLEAFETTFKREFDFNSQSDMDTWNDTWTQIRIAKFNIAYR